MILRLALVVLKVLTRNEHTHISVEEHREIGRFSGFSWSFRGSFPIFYEFPVFWGEAVPAAPTVARARAAAFWPWTGLRVWGLGSRVLIGRRFILGDDVAKKHDYLKRPVLSPRIRGIQGKFRENPG